MILKNKIIAILQQRYIKMLGRVQFYSTAE